MAAVRHWIAVVADALEFAERAVRTASAAAVFGQDKQYNSIVEDADAAADGYASGETARQERIERGWSAWDDKFGHHLDPAIQAKLAAFERDMAAERAAESKKRAEAPTVRRRRRRRP